MTPSGHGHVIARPVDVPGVGDGSAVAIAADLRWLRMPLLGPLGFINVWALAGEEGWTIVDTGLGDDATAAAWRAALAGPLADWPVARVMVTHGHIDHVGSAGWLAAECGADLLVTPGEYRQAEGILTGADAAFLAALGRSAGWDAATTARFLERSAAIRAMLRPLPDHVITMRAGDTLQAAGAWRLIGSSGHSPEHVALWQAERGLLIAGDQLLPGLAANVTIPRDAPAADPMRDWLAGLADLRRLVPNDVLVLPAHGDPYVGVHDRIDELVAIYRGRISRTLEALSTPRCAVDLVDATAGRPIKPASLPLATFETLSCLRYLAADAMVASATDADRRVIWMRSAEAETP